MYANKYESKQKNVPEKRYSSHRSYCFQDGNKSKARELSELLGKSQIS